MKVNNALVTWDDLATMGLTAKGTPPTGKGIANKAELIAAYYVDEAASPFSTYTSDRCPPYQTIQNTTTTTTTVQPALTFDIGYVCTSPTQTITVNNFAGGDGTYYASTTTYPDAVSAGAGAVTLVSGTSRSYTAQSGSYGSSTRYVKVTSGAYSLIKQAGACCDVAPNWSNNGSVFCSSCVSYQPQIDVNPCSPTYNTTRNLSLGAGAPCDYSANWVYQYQNCNSCTTSNVDRDLNPCSSTYLNYRLGGVNVGNSAPANTGACNTSQNWVNNGSYTCSGCNKYYVEVQNNPCASGYGSTRQGGLVESNSTYCGGCCGQSTSATWTLMFGSFSCSGCNKYYNEYDSNPCSPTYNTVRMSGTVAEYNSTYCGGCCGQSTAANWVLVFGQYTCGACAKYTVEQDMNSCSPTYGQQRAGMVVENPSPYCCPGVLTCYSLTSGTSYYDGCNGTSNWNEVYTITLKDQYGNTTTNTTGSALTFTFQYDYYDHEDYYGCEGGGTAYRDLIIYPGQSFGQAIFYTHQNQYCCYSSNCDGSCFSEEYNVNLISAPLSAC